MDLMLGPVRCPAILVFVGSVKCCSSSIVLHYASMVELVVRLLRKVVAIRAAGDYL